MRKFLLLLFGVTTCLGIVVGCARVSAQVKTGAVKLFFTPSSGNFLTDSLVDVSLLLDTGNEAVNVIDVKVEFPPDKLQVVRPSTGDSFVSIWLQQPTYSNKNGTITFSGGVPEKGIRSSSAVISTITFRVKEPGPAILKFSTTSSVLAADGLGSKLPVISGRAVLNLVPKPPEGPVVFSVTHPDPNKWYNNNNVILGWELDNGVATTSYSYSLTQNPSEIPDNIDDGSDTTTHYPNLADGIWYFHLKQKRQGVYGDTTHYQLKIDTTAPASFKPTVDLLKASIFLQKAFVNFFTTDALSGINHYEIALFDKSKESGDAPIFLEAASPYRIPDIGTGNVRIIIRAFDNAGNTRDAVIDTESINVIQSWLNIFQSWLHNDFFVSIVISFNLLIVIFALRYVIIQHRKSKIYREANAYNQ